MTTPRRAQSQPLLLGREEKRLARVAERKRRERARIAEAKAASTLVKRDSKIEQLHEQVKADACEALSEIAIAFGTTVEAIYQALREEEMKEEEEENEAEAGAGEL